MKIALNTCSSALAVKSKKKKKIGSRETELLAEFKNYKRPSGMTESMARILEDIIRKIFTSSPTASHEKLLNFQEMRELCLRTRELLLIEPCFVEISPPLFIIGDVHGQLYDLLDILNYIGYPPQKRLLFLGDYVDRGDYSLETITMLLAFKLRFPKEIYLLRGNHETRCVNRQYGFYDECKKKFPRKGVELWTVFQHVFNCLPMAGLVGSKIFCAHGGISEDLVSFKQFERVYRPTDICDIGLLCDLIWSDPSSACSMFDPSPRGVSSVFGKQAVNNFCTKMHVDLICRAHQCVMDGYEFFADKKCLTLFSAPCYCGELDNQAAVLHVSGRLECRVLTFKRDTGMATAEYARTVETPGTGRPGAAAGRSESKTPTGSARKDVKGEKLTGTRSSESAPGPVNKAEKKNVRAAVTPRADSTQTTPGKKTPK